MILQGLVLILACGLGSGFPQTWQYQRQLFYNPPLATLTRHPAQYAPAVRQPILAKTQLQPATVYVQPQQYIPAGELQQPIVYVFSPQGGYQGEPVLRQETGGTTYPGSGYVDSFLNLFQNFGSPWQFWQPAAPTPAPAGSAPAPAPPGTKDSPEAPVDSESTPEKEGTSSSEEGTSSENASVESTNEQNRRLLFAQDPAQYFPSQFVYRTHPFQVESVREKAGNAAISFQKYLALAKQKKIKEDEDEDMDEQEDDSVEADNKESSSSTTEGQATETSEAPDTADIGPSIAQAKPQAVSVAGPGGVAAAAPVATAVVGPGGMALSAPTAMAIAGAKGSAKNPSSIASSRIKNHFKQSSVPGYYFQY